jgi:hypothetical protein
MVRGEQARRLPTRVVAAVLVASALSLGARPAGAYTFVDEIPEDPCSRARQFDPQDSSAAAQHARRACRLEVFERRLADERSQAVLNEQNARTQWAEKWLEGSQPARVVHPLAVELFAGSGIVNYGAGLSWTALRNLEVAARVGQRQMSCAQNQYSGTGADCTRTTWGLAARWLLFDYNFSPFLGTAFSSTNAPLKIVHPDMMGQNTFLDGKGTANTLGASVGVQLAASYVRFSLEYLYEYILYTGANLNDSDRTPSEDLRAVWEQSLKLDSNGVRFQVSLAF